MEFTFSPRIVHAFTQGDCYRLARSLTRHGYPIALTGVANSQGDMFWVHALNATPDGSFVDIARVYDNEEDVLSEWEEEIRNVFGVHGLDIICVITGDEARAVLDDSHCEAFYPEISPSRYANAIHSMLTSSNQGHAS